MQSEIAEELQFHAELVSGHEEEFTPDYIVYGIHFGEGDPEQGGQHWNFTRTLDDDDDGVCTVKEIQEVVVYGGIKKCTLTRQQFTCDFDEDTAQETSTRRLHVTYKIDDETWQALKTQAMKVFDGEGYFQLQE